MSDHDTSPLRPEADDLLQAALSDPFSVPPNLTRISPTQSTSQPPPSEPPAASAALEQPEQPTLSSSSSSPVSAAEQEAWRVEHEAQVAEWRRQSAGSRARAETERARWEERRARERAEQQQLQQEAAAGLLRGTTPARTDTCGTSGTSEWEAVSQQSASASVSVLASSDAGTGGVSLSLSPKDSSSGPGADAAAHAQGTQAPNQHRPTSSNAPARRSATGDPTDSPQWENVSSSPTSSFPSMSFPEPSRPHSPEHSTHAAARATMTTTTTTTTAATHSATAASMTLAVFDHTLPASTRFWAFCSSLSINFFLPFVNGVMLGFGEIFAKTVIVEWLGWGPSVATNVGLGIRPQNRRQ